MGAGPQRVRVRALSEGTSNTPLLDQGRWSAELGRVFEQALAGVTGPDGTRRRSDGHSIIDAPRIDP
jgi:hypothetical protein